MPLLENLETLYKEGEKFKALGWERFCEFGLPTNKMAGYGYLRLASLVDKTYTPPTRFEPEVACDKPTLVFANGRFIGGHNLPKDLIALSLSQGIKKYHTFFANRFKQSVGNERDPLALLNAALFEDGLFLYLPPTVVCEEPIEIVHHYNNDVLPSLVCPRVHLFASKGSKIKLVAKQEGSNTWINTVADFVLENGASVEYVTQYESETWHTEAVRATLKAASTFKTVSAGKMKRQDFHIQLAGVESEAYLYGIAQLAGKEEIHTNVLMEHIAPHTNSFQKFKAVLDEASRASFEGKIYVHPEAQKTDAYQMSNHLILSDNASSNARPNLEILADDVKASHGATVGQLDEEELFYLTSRGMDKASAHKLLLNGFCQEILDEL